LILKISLRHKKEKPLLILLSKKIVSAACKRHLLKRRIKSILYPLISKNQKVLVIVKEPITSLSFKELEKILKENYARITRSSNHC